MSVSGRGVWVVEGAEVAVAVAGDVAATFWDEGVAVGATAARHPANQAARVPRLS